MAQPAVAASSIHRDGGSAIALVKSIDPIVASGAAPTKTGSAVDLKGYDGAVVIFHIGATGDTLSGSVKLTPSVTECDTSGGTYAAIPAAGYRVDIGDVADIDANTKDEKVVQVTLLGARKQFIKPVITFVGTHTNGIPVAASVLKTNPRFAPATA